MYIIHVYIILYFYIYVCMHNGMHIIHVYTCVYAVEPPNKGQVGAATLVHFSEVVLYWGVSKSLITICIVCHIFILQDL